MHASVRPCVCVHMAPPCADVSPRRYVRDLRAQSADVQTILSAMDDQVKAASATYREQLEEIETAFMVERQELVEAARKEWDAAMARRKTEEEACIAAMEDRTEQQHRQLEHLRLTDDEE